MCKMIISAGGFLNFFKILVFWVVKGVKGQKMVQNDKKSLSCSISQEPYIIWLSFMVMCKMMLSLGFFFQFFQILIFQIVREVKLQKTVQNDKKLCPSCFISQEPYIIWLSFMICMCKMIISPGFFSVFQNFDFESCQEAERAKKVPKWQEILPVSLRISGTIHHMIVIFGAHV